MAPTISSEGAHADRDGRCTCGAGQLPAKGSDGTDATDYNPYYGQALFTFGAGPVDQPLSVTRLNYADTQDSLGKPSSYVQWPIVSITPLWNALGRWDNAFVSPLYAATTHKFRFGTQLGWQSYAMFPPLLPESWLGSVLEGKRDQVGTAYRRARVYDPATGQFTQEDPLA